MYIQMSQYTHTHTKGKHLENNTCSEKNSPQYLNCFYYNIIHINNKIIKFLNFITERNMLPTSWPAGKSSLPFFLSWCCRNNCQSSKSELCSMPYSLHWLL